MKLHFLQKNLDSDIKVSKNKEKEFLKLWHYHPETEIVYIVKGTGTLYAGDYIGSFKENDIFYIGSNVPHMFDSTRQEEQDDNYSLAYVIHIKEDTLQFNKASGNTFSYIKKLQDTGKRGILFRSQATYPIMQILDKMNTNTIHENGIALLNLFYQLHNIEDKFILSSKHWLLNYEVKDVRLNKVIQHIMENFQKPLALEEIAYMSGMNKSAFCRYFKNKTDKSFIAFLNELRINYACKVLNESEPQKSISEACYRSGFNSLSYFNRTFKKVKGIAPSQYRRITI
ncbi:AraC-type DNA-binding protein [Zhouia amylolytica]|uniref:HTH araC/xylS-type domain-containing protein n=2 Tax=Zhouia amylolytica TaxID=376730 RepID=W2UMB0_9FLAO|nr:AraC family transcriptional regulator [Zhouia amylolytica]ETN95148.1 hypothetical protein P278_19030 [Zhouia amylolytica AD3]SFS68307.1 AraC-type DNA-binding protein [Zhouia amylolytica]